MTIEIFHDQSVRKYGNKLGSNSRPLDLQPDLLPTALRCPVYMTGMLQVNRMKIGGECCT